MLSAIAAVAVLAVGLANAQVGEWGQCGQYYYGSTQCVSPYTCVFSNPYYSQCLLVSGNTPTTSSTTSTTSTRTTTTTSHSGPTTTTSTGTISTATGNPYVGKTVYLIPEYVQEVQAAVALISDPSVAALATAVETIPVFFWMDVAAKVPTLGQYLADAASKGSNQLVQAVIYDLPDRDCAAYSSAGEYTIADNGATYYQAYIDAIAAQVSAYLSVTVVFVVEPDGLANLVTNESVAKCANAASTYKTLVSYAISKLQQSNVYLYLDAGHSGWLGWPANITPAAQLFGQILQGAGSGAKVRGLATDVSNYNALRGPEDPAQSPNPNYDEELYINALAPLLSQNNYPAHFIVDQSRSGVIDIRTAEGDWCNVLGAGLGIRPTLDTGNTLIDAIVWVKPPGEADGTSNTSSPRYDPHCGQSDAAQPAPEAGTWFQSYFVTLVEKANPPLTPTSVTSTGPTSTSSTRISTTTRSTTTSTTTTTTTTTTTSSTSSGPTQSTGVIPPLGGVNLAGFDFSVYTNGSFTGPGATPPISQIPHFSVQGANLFRIPFAWQLATPTLGGQVDSTWLAKYDTVVNAALNTGAWVILDLHNYARWNGGIINQGGPTIDQFASVWSQLASHYANHPNVIFGLMNEPHDLPSVSAWIPAVQGAVNAIRAAGATSQYILMPGSSYSSAQALPTEAGPGLLTVTDPSGGVTKLIFDVHKYLDSDNSGTHPDCVTNNSDVFNTLIAWLQQNGRQAILSETGGGSTSTCETDLAQQLAQIKDAYPTMIGFAIWAAGAFDTTYTLTVTPNANGSDQPIWTIAVIPNLPRNLPAGTTTTTVASTSSSSTIGTTTTTQSSTTSRTSTTTTSIHVTTTVSSPPVTVTGNPYVGATTYLIPEYIAEVQAAAAQISDATTKTKALSVANIPVFFWMDVAAKVPTLGQYLADAASRGANQLVQAVIYDLPDRDCAAYSSAGEYTIANNGATYYQAYIDAIAAQVNLYPSVRVVFVVEPDGLANLVTNMSVAKCANASSTYKTLVSYAISKLQQHNVWLYLDAGHSGWLGWPANITPAAQLFGQILQGAGSGAKVRGLATDVSNYNALRGTEDPAQQPNPNYDEELYINALAPLLQQNNYPAAFIVDQSRSGQIGIRTAEGDWCNVLNAGLGIRPTTSTGNTLIDAIVWVKPPGEADGTSNTSSPRYDPHCGQSDAAQPAPEAGTWFQSYFVTLVQKANPSL